MVLFKNEKITILYGSQTGNAQDLAERIWRESKQYYFTGLVKSMDDYDVFGLTNEKCVIFVCSTTGQGEEPDNMKNFWMFLLRKNLPHDFLLNMRFAVLGLGDSCYAKFNFTAKRLNKRLMQLGAQMIIPVGLGDDQHDLGYDAIVEPWIDSLWVHLLATYPLPNGIAPVHKNLKITPRWSVSTRPYSDVDKISRVQSIYNSTRLPFEFYVNIKENIRTTHESHFQDVRLIKFQTNGEKYGPGDVVCLRPKNLAIQVKEFQKILNENGICIAPDTIFELSKTDAEMPVPTSLNYGVTFQQLCDEYFDLTAIPKRHTFNVLAQLTDNDLERDKCLEFVSAEGQNDLYSYCNRPRRNIVEVLQDFPNATKNLTMDMLFEIMNPIKPREFSIASSYSDTNNEIHILVAVVKFKTKLVKERLGLCSNYLAGLKNGDRISVWIKRGSFSFPSKGAVIMVGPGTGVAPFRNYIMERSVQNNAKSDSLILFFGCRGKSKDFHFKEEFLKLDEERKLSLICAFSRDQNYKVYVQHKLIDNGEMVWNLIKDKSSYIFVAGNSKNMPQEVREAFVNICMEGGKMNKDDANKFIMELEKKKLYQSETWS